MLDRTRTVIWWRFAAMWCPTAGWFRIFGYGLRWTDVRSWGLNFSQRNGYERYWQLGRWTVAVLWPDRASAKVTPERQPRPPARVAFVRK